MIRGTMHGTQNHFEFVESIYRRDQESYYNVLIVINYLP
jgi:hypothetical protein